MRNLTTQAFAALLLVLAVPSARASEAVRDALEVARAAHIHVDGVRLLATPSLVKTYEARGFAPIWLDEAGAARVRALREAVDRVGEHGLESAAYHPESLARLAKTPDVRLELRASDTFLRLAADLSGGHVDPEAIDPEWHAQRPDADPVAMLLAVAGGEPVDRVLARALPKDPRYGLLQGALSRLVDVEADGGWPTVGAGPDLSAGAKGPRVANLIARLRASGDLVTATTTFDDEVTAAVKRFQRRHGLPQTGTVSTLTLAALDVSVGDRITQLEVNLERWRWLPRDLGPRHVLVNIAGFRLEAWNAGTAELGAAVQVGKPFRRTPVLSDQISHLVLNPTWTVPPGILKADVLPAIRKDVGWLARKNMQVFRGWDPASAPIDPTKVDWSQVTVNSGYRFVQQPGPDNALGRIKVMFPNRFNVYVHDTPSRELFNREERAFSSGCVRVQDPEAFAAWLLAPQGWDQGRVNRVVAAGKEQTVNLSSKVPVHILYWTAWIDSEGALHFRKDVYSRDAALAHALAAPPPA